MTAQVWSGQKGYEGKTEISKDTHTFCCGCSVIGGKHIIIVPAAHDHLALLLTGPMALRKIL